MNQNAVMSSTNEKKNNFFLEKNRMETFKSWPFNDRQKCSIKKMAEAGFYWCGSVKEEDTAACFLCGKVLDGWESTDDPWSEHKKHAPQCAFVKLGRPQRQLTVAEIIDLMDAYISKIRDDVAGKVQKFASEKSKEIREKLATVYKV